MGHISKKKKLRLLDSKINIEKINIFIKIDILREEANNGNYKTILGKFQREI